MGQEFMRTARAKGLDERVVLRRHALGNVMLPIVTILGLEAATLMGGAIIIEQVFALNGLGRLFWESVTMRDYPVIPGAGAVHGRRLRASVPLDRLDVRLAGFACAADGW
jgi:peptide/nickel transport system permease protein